ncbi:PREDICTED: histone-lysine N-methyltransferase 2D isoform X2 [Drosophila arizonae]|uniref:Histone-lysine N-methyltransferase 2D isoform X2 n=1 Tax=Drosophila arizonae TaxID=7263 RepID=A0ABM1PPL9_DROAR|nr:PREDICTED: histone-lysine N-methyltransferase 2D isoform X2 [Drosophila arizonae]
MDSEVETSANETKSEQPEVAMDDAGERVLDRAEGSVVENGQKTTTTTTVVVIKNENAKPDEELEADPQTETESDTTTTTVGVTKKENESDDKESASATATTTIVVAKNEPDPAAASDKEIKTSATTTTVVVSPKKEEDIETEKQITVSNPNADAPSSAKETANEAAAKDDCEFKERSVFVEEAEEEEGEGDTEEEQEESDDDEDDDDGEDLKIATKTEEIKDEEGQSNIPEKSEVAAESTISQDENAVKSNDINNQIENIISDIDINIKAQEKIAQLKEQELQLIQKQKELANQIQQQQLLAQKLIAENQLKEQELQRQKYVQQQPQPHPQSPRQYTEEIEPTIKQDRCSTNMFQRQEDSNKFQESCNISRTVDLRKIFTPATDAPQILPKNRKLYASSAFYSPTLHPTVEDQVELARRISHSLSDISNQTSKGQTMYVNRKKRSVKWVHEGCGQGEDEDIIETRSLSKENAEDNSLQPELIKLDKMPLKLVMNPRGQMRDYNSLKESINIESGLLSPDNCAELITALQLHKGRGAELFAKRRRKADNWVVDETNAGIHSPSGIPDYQQYQVNRPAAASPSIVPAYSDAGKHRVQLNLHQDQLIEKYSRPGVQVVKSPWEAALQTGSASTAFLDQSQYRSPTPIATQPSPVHFTQDFTDSPLPASYVNQSNYTQDSYKSSLDSRAKSQPIQSSNPQRELAYKPSVAQGWGGRNVELPRGLYVPKEISLASYAPPPVLPTHNFQSSPKPIDYSSKAYEPPPYNSFPVANQKSGLYNSVPPKQQLYNPTSYQKVLSGSQQSGTQVTFSPSPLSFDKLSKFQESSDQRNQRLLNVNKQPVYRGVQNVSPTPFLSAGTDGREGRSPISSPTYGSHTSHNAGSQQMMHGGNQSFNNCARGWNKGSNNIQQSAYYPKTVPVAATESLPYSDF